MIDILNFKRRSYTLDVKSNTALISMPLSIKEFKDVFNDYSNEEDGLKALAYVANIAHYGSPGNIVGLTGRELIADVKDNLGLPQSFKETNKIKLAIIAYNKHYNRGVFGLFKELNKSFDMTRNSISVINVSLEDIMRDVKNQQKLKDVSPAEILTKIKTVIDAISQVRQLTNDLSSDVQKLREIEGILLSEEETSAQLYGGGTIPQSSKVND